MNFTDEQLLEFLPSKRRDELTNGIVLRDFFKPRTPYKALADLLDVSPQAISNWFSGEHNIPVERQKQLCEIKNRMEAIEEKTGLPWGAKKGE